MWNQFSFNTQNVHLNSLLLMWLLSFQEINLYAKQHALDASAP